MLHDFPSVRKPDRSGAKTYSWVFGFKNARHGDFPSGPTVKNLPANAGDVGLIPGWGTKILHAAEQLEKPACHDGDPVQPNQPINQDYF